MTAIYTHCTFHCVEPQQLREYLQLKWELESEDSVAMASTSHTIKRERFDDKY